MPVRTDHFDQRSQTQASLLDVRCGVAKNGRPLRGERPAQLGDGFGVTRGGVLIVGVADGCGEGHLSPWLIADGSWSW
ncbi:hypothetical protein [Streptomyces salinarius]|uniref:PPM-type phosphatase domain-containing protein n=1 Tax=Streptomyces salinarius TaxID=2762598 RepID=A0ABW8BBF2_9ACTN